MDFALALDLNRKPRLSRTSATPLQIHNRRQANERERSIVLHTVKLWGWHGPMVMYKKRRKIARAVCNQVVYDFGFAHSLAVTQMHQWFGELYRCINEGKDTDPLLPLHSRSKTYVLTIEQAHEGYLHELFRHAQYVHGPLATFGELAEAINAKSAIEGEDCLTLSISAKQVSQWFKKKNGKEKSPIENPLLSNEHKQRWVQWARDPWDKLTTNQEPVAFLDEKWFYTYK